MSQIFTRPVGMAMFAPTIGLSASRVWRDFARWCGAAPGPAFVEDWTPLRSERAAVATEHAFVGEVVSAARVVGNRRIEAIIADRERRLREMLAREAR